MGRLLLFGGKGGVGKTTTAAGTAMWLAASGYRTLLVSSDPAHSTSDALEVELGSSPTEVPGVANLWGMELDPKAQMEELMPQVRESMRGDMPGGLRAMMGMGGVDVDGLEAELDGVEAEELIIPGLDEALAFDQLLQHVEDPRFDALCFDTAPTGHTLRFLSLPELLDTWMKRILRMMRMTGGLRSMLLGGGKQNEARAELERLQRRVRHVRRVLADPRHATFVLVTIPEQMAVAETKRAARALAQYLITIGGVVVNRMTPDLDHPFIQGRRSAELAHLGELKQTFGDLPVAEVALATTDIHGLDAMEAVGRLLHGDPVEPPESLEEVEIGLQLPLKMRRGLYVEQTDEGLVVQLHLPGAAKEDLDLRAEGTCLYVAVNGRESEVELGQVVDVSKATARHEDDILRLVISD